MQMKQYSVTLMHNKKAHSLNIKHQIYISILWFLIFFLKGKPRISDCQSRFTFWMKHLNLTSTGTHRVQPVGFHLTEGLAGPCWSKHHHTCPKQTAETTVQFHSPAACCKKTVPNKRISELKTQYRGYVTIWGLRFDVLVGFESKWQSKITHLITLKVNKPDGVKLVLSPFSSLNSEDLTWVLSMNILSVENFYHKCVDGQVQWTLSRIYINTVIKGRCRVTMPCHGVQNKCY